MHVRRFESPDAARLCEIHYRSVHEVGRAKYDAAQVQAWAPGIPDAAHWLPRLSEYETFVAENKRGILVAWVSMSSSGYVDMLYCLPEATRCGIADELYEAVERIARDRHLERMTAHASLFAQPFFRRHGWSIDEHELVERNGVLLPRAKMSKNLNGSSPEESCARQDSNL